MKKFWISLFLLVPVLGTAVFVVAWMKKAWLPENISTLGKEIDLLFYIILAITGVVFLFTEGLLVVALAGARGEDAPKARFFHGNNLMEFTWTVLTAAMLIFIALYQIPIWAKAKYASHRPNKDPDALVTASQFMWQVRYPLWDEQSGRPHKLDTRNPDVMRSFELINELHVPAGEPILIHLTTRDVIHSFWLPKARVKQDALPGHLIPVWFDAQKPGTYEWVCAELCGWGHYRMRAKLFVHEKAEFEKWLQEKSREFLSTKQALVR
ncbi:MAG: cytochrome c oxidase subunit II [Gemmataceae bacterium]